MTSDDERFLQHLRSLGVPGIPLAAEHRRLGLDRNTEEGALLAFSGSLRRRSPLHRLVAWVMLVAVALPGLTTLAWLVDQGLRLIWRQAG